MVVKTGPVKRKDVVKSANRPGLALVPMQMAIQYVLKIHRLDVLNPVSLSVAKRETNASPVHVKVAATDLKL